MPKRHEANNRLPLFLAVPLLSIYNYKTVSKFDHVRPFMHKSFLFFYICKKSGGCFRMYVKDDASSDLSAIRNHADEASLQVILKVLKQETENEARMKSMQHRIDKAEGREDELINDIHRLNMQLLSESKQSKRAMTIIKVFGSVMTAGSILLNIIRMFAST